MLNMYVYLHTIPFSHYIKYIPIQNVFENIPIAIHQILNIKLFIEL